MAALSRGVFPAGDSTAISFHSTMLEAAVLAALVVFRFGRAAGRGQAIDTDKATAKVERLAVFLNTSVRSKNVSHCARWCFQRYSAAAGARGGGYLMPGLQPELWLGSAHEAADVATSGMLYTLWKGAAYLKGQELNISWAAGGRDPQFFLEAAPLDGLDDRQIARLLESTCALPIDESVYARIHSSLLAERDYAIATPGPSKRGRSTGKRGRPRDAAARVRRREVERLWKAGQTNVSKIAKALGLEQSHTVYNDLKALGLRGGNSQ